MRTRKPKKLTEKKSYENKKRSLKLKVGSYTSAIKVERKRIEAIGIRIRELENRQNEVFRQLGELEIRYKHHEESSDLLQPSSKKTS